MISAVATLFFFLMLFESFARKRVPTERPALALSAVYPRSYYSYMAIASVRRYRILVHRYPALKNRIVVLFTSWNEVRFPAYAEVDSRINKLPKGSCIRPYSNLGLVLTTIPSHSQMVEFQLPATPIMEGIVDLHNDIMFFLTFVVVFVMYLLSASFFTFSRCLDKPYLRYGYAGDDWTHNTPIEII
jgi:hypothetical protein